MKILLFIRWLTLTAAILVAAYVVEGIHVASALPAVLAAAVLGLLNLFLRPLLLILTLPINLLSLGLFTLVINAALLKIASSLIPGFDVHGFWSAVFGALLISMVSWIVTSLISGRNAGIGPKGRQKQGKTDTIELHRVDDDRWE